MRQVNELDIGIMIISEGNTITISDGKSSVSAELNTNEEMAALLDGLNSAIDAIRKTEARDKRYGSDEPCQGCGK